MWATYSGRPRAPRSCWSDWRADMTAAALVAIGAAPFESDVLTATSASGLVVVRRCVDVADLLATAATRQAGVALVSTALLGIDAEVLARLTSEQVVVVGVARP